MTTDGSNFLLLYSRKGFDTLIDTLEHDNSSSSHSAGSIVGGALSDLLFLVLF
jgi:hypothetical protein